MQSGIAISKVNLAAKRLLELANTAIVICIDINQIGQNCVCSWKVEKHTQTDRHLNDHHYATHIRSWSSSNAHKTARLKCSKEKVETLYNKLVWFAYQQERKIENDSKQMREKEWKGNQSAKSISALLPRMGIPFHLHFFAQEHQTCSLARNCLVHRISSNKWVVLIIPSS